MCGAVRTLAWLSVAAGVIAIGVLCGAYIPYKNFNARIVKTTCHRYYGVRSYYCQRVGVTQTCYDVTKNTQPDGADCWQAPAIATFTNKAQADQYASQFSNYNFPCYVDPQSRCNYYDGPANTDAPLYAGSAFVIIFIVFVSSAILSWSINRKRSNQQNSEKAPLV